MVESSLHGVTQDQQRELAAMLRRLSALWSELTEAAQHNDSARVDAIKRDIATCRARLEEIKRSGRAGTA